MIKYIILLLLSVNLIAQPTYTDDYKDTITIVEGGIATWSDDNVYVVSGGDTSSFDYKIWENNTIQIWENNTIQIWNENELSINIIKDEKEFNLFAFVDNRKRIFTTHS